LGQENGKIALGRRRSGKNQGQVVADNGAGRVGRKANVEVYSLRMQGSHTRRKAFKTDETLRTTASNIICVRDVVGPYQFQHMAEYQARIAKRNALLPLAKRVDYTHYIWCMFTDPELAHTGLTEEEAREQYGMESRCPVGVQGDGQGRTDGEELPEQDHMRWKVRIVGATSWEQGGRRDPRDTGGKDTRPAAFTTR